MLIKPLIVLISIVSLQLLACVNQPSVQNGIYFYKGYVGEGDHAVLADFTFEMTASVCEVVVSAGGTNESFLCSVKKDGSNQISVHFQSYRNADKESIFSANYLDVGDMLFSLSLEKRGYITDWATLHPSKRYAKSGTYFFHTYQK